MSNTQSNNPLPPTLTQEQFEELQKKVKEQKAEVRSHDLKCGLCGALWLAFGIVMLYAYFAHGNVPWWLAAIVIVYGLWLLSGLATKGWRFLIY